MQESANETQNQLNGDTPPLVQENSDVEISFQLSMPNGVVVEETGEGESFRFTIGDGTFLNKLDELLIGLEVGTTGTFTIPPEQGFGQPDPANLQTMSKSDFPADMPLEEGHVIGFNTPTGEEIPGKVHEVDGDKVIIDFNHPLAGQTVIFKAKILAIHS
ncbi:peptidylprolyl isomerase [Thiomicrorhabdus sp. ZW0627]|uniref:FKBP-type peptidyl-prolyl cis-trans isomerase n=1 Tax=Thiomicrorhabdus sp. ZW0627 TaxID=3039774 RepID=UPI002436C56D|nr:peptidylprolyl isomerase [Thiomicrorhabdus sp. ZW0627]MDG6772825.1 peptidylprolyl isomerase [Thiomicrorhabdus sp. ZW0627]